MSDYDLLAWAGRLHPLLLHVPVVLVLAAAALVLGPWREGAGARAAARLALVCAVPGALLALGSGWLLAAGEKPSDALELHRWLGVASAALVLVAWLRARRVESASARVLLALAALATIACAHVGASLVWGARWLWPPPTRAPAAEAAPRAEEAPLAPSGPSEDPARASEQALRRGLAAGVRALLARHCVECHGPAKQKGDLRLDELAPLLADEPARGVVRPGAPEASELVRLVSLPPDDLDVMPAEGEHLSADEIALLRAWIEAGAPH